MKFETGQKIILRDLGGGLVLRRATLADADALAELNGGIHSDEWPGPHDPRLAAWTHDLASGSHPTFAPADFTVVENTTTGQLVSSSCLISQTWTYAGIPFKVGRPELVGTLPEYRERGLVRAQFEALHAWSAERGELVQGITGIPFYYRQFGYEMALDLGGGRAGFMPHIPRLPQGQAEPFRFRPVLEADLDFVLETYQFGCRRNLISCRWDKALLRYEISGKSQLNVNRLELRLIETQQGAPVGFIGHPFYNWEGMLVVQVYELKPGVSWEAVTPSVIRYLEATGKELVEQAPAKEPFAAYGFWLGAEHPVYQVVRDRLPRVRPPYAWYLRVPDLQGFILTIAPLLEARLADSALSVYSGELKLSFYRTGLRLGFVDGRFSLIEPWKPSPQGHSGDALFPGLTFLQLLFGYRSLNELKYAFPDCSTHGDQAPALLEILFPRQASNLWAIS